MSIIYLMAVGLGVLFLTVGKGELLVEAIGFGLLLFGLDKLIEEKIQSSREN